MLDETRAKFQITMETFGILGNSGSAKDEVEVHGGKAAYFKVFSYRKRRRTSGPDGRHPLWSTTGKSVGWTMTVLMLLVLSADAFVKKKIDVYVAGFFPVSTRERMAAFRLCCYGTWQPSWGVM